MQVGEVIGGSITDLLVQVKATAETCWSINFGAFIKIKSQNNEIVGVVVDARYETLTGARPMSRWIKERKTFHKIYPDIHEKFLSIAEVFVLGYAEKDDFRQILPPTPPEMHSPVMSMSDEEIKGFHGVNPEKQQVKIDYIYRLIDELHTGRCIDLLRTVVDRLETFGLNRETIIREISGAYMALGEEEVALKVSSLLLRGK